MEIIDYIRALGRKLWLLLLIPLLAGAIAGGLLMRQPPNYRASATVSLLGLAEGSRDTDLLIADFEGALTTPALVDRVSQGTGIPEEEIAEGLSSARVGTSSLLEVGFVTPRNNPEETSRLLTLASTEALGFLTNPDLGFAQQRLAQSQRGVDDSQRAIDDFIAETGLAAPEDEYRARQTELSDLRVRAEEFRAEGSATTADALEDSAARVEDSLAALAPQAAEFRRLQADRDAAAVAYGQALQEFQAISVRGPGPQAVVVADPEPIGDLAAGLRRVVAVMAASFILAALVIVLLDVVGSDRRRRRRSQEPVPSTVADEGPVPERASYRVPTR